MPIPKDKLERRRRRSSAVPLTIVPALAALVTAASCSARRTFDPCEPATYSQTACEIAVANRGYWYGGIWYPHVYSYLPAYYYNGYHSFLMGGGRVQSLAPTTYAPPTSVPSRPSVVRGGFGGIGAGMGEAAGS